MYEKVGEKYFVLDGHVHFWDASPENWIEGQEQYAKGWIECFYGYHQLGPEEYYWPMEKYQKYSEETMMKDLFEGGYVDKAIFRRKSFVARQEQLCRELLAEDHVPEDLAGMIIGDVPASSLLEKYLERRIELGLDTSDDAPLLVDPDGKRVPEAAVIQHLRHARTVRVSIEGNAELCKGLLATRYNLSDREEATA